MVENPDAEGDELPGIFVVYALNYLSPRRVCNESYMKAI